MHVCKCCIIRMMHVSCVAVLVATLSCAPPHVTGTCILWIWVGDEAAEPALDLDVEDTRAGVDAYDMHLMQHGTFCTLWDVLALKEQYFNVVMFVEAGVGWAEVTLLMGSGISPVAVARAQAQVEVEYDPFAPDEYYDALTKYLTKHGK